MFTRTLGIVLLFPINLMLAAEPEAKQFDRLCHDALKRWDVPGLALVVVHQERTLYLQGHGGRELGGPAITPDTVFPLASCSKAFTAAIAGTLVDDGVWAWDDRVSKHLKDFRLADPAANTLVTIRDLLAHRTGVDGHDLLWYRAPWSQIEAIRRVGKLPLAQPFRGGMQYQSIMYMAVGQAIEQASKKPWDELLHERLLRPLAMKNTSTTTTQAFKHTDRATGYRINKEGQLIAVPWYEIKEPNAAGSINSTARDLAAWLRLQLNNGLHGETRVIADDTLQETRRAQIMIRRPEPDPLSPDSIQVSYGLGWVVQDYRGRLLVQHAGLIDGFRVHFALLPNEGYGWAILANREGTRLNLALSNQLADLLTGLPAKDWHKHYQDALADDETAALVRAKREEQARQTDTTPTVTLDAFTGRYSHPAYGTATIRRVKDRLVWDWGSWQLPLEHYHHDIFRLQSDHPRLDRAFARFVVREGKVRELHLPAMTFSRDD